MSESASSRRVSPAKDKHAAATSETVRVQPIGNTTKEDDNRSERAAQSCFGHGYSQSQLDRARRTVQRAETWRADNADAYRAIEAYALEMASRGERVSTRDYLKVVHSKAYVDRFGKDATINADFCPAIARWLCMEHPEVKPFIELRRCPVGVVMGV